MKWDGAALAWVIDQVQELGEFAETHWTHRSIVEIPLKKKSDGWFLHAMTGHEAYFKLVFRLPGRPFKKDPLAAQLALPPLSDTPGFEGYSRDENRVEVVSFPGGQQVMFVAHKKSELDTPAFRSFLTRAIEVVAARAETTGGGVEGNMPWKKDGEKWHLGQKGFPPGRGAKWDRTILPRFVALLREIEPGLEFKWDVRDAITVYPKGAGRFWARLKTKEAEALEIWFTGRRGAAKAALYESLSNDARVEGDRADGSEVLKLSYLTDARFDPRKLKPLLLEHLKAFKKAFGAEGK
jgi:excinuclease ABC subunit A